MFFLDHLVESIKRIAGAADLGEHAAGHFVHFGEGFLHLQVVEVLAEAFDFLAGRLDGGVAGHGEFLVGCLGIDQLGAVVRQVLADALEFEGDLAGEALVAGADVRGGLGLEVGLHLFLAFHLGDELFTKAGMGGEALVELGDLFAEIFLFHFEQRFGVAFFQTGNEEAQKASEDIGDAAEHGRMGLVRLS